MSRSAGIYRHIFAQGRCAVLEQRQTPAPRQWCRQGKHRAGHPMGASEIAHPRSRDRLPARVDSPPPRSQAVNPERQGRLDLSDGTE
jgi:hypothetical protein